MLKHGVGTVSINKTDLLSIPVPLIDKKFQVKIGKVYKGILADYRNGWSNSQLLRDKMQALIRYLESELTGFKLER